MQKKTEKLFKSAMVDEEENNMNDDDYDFETDYVFQDNGKSVEDLDDDIELDDI
jgi:hypothetical protein